MVYMFLIREIKNENKLSITQRLIGRVAVKQTDKHGRHRYKQKSIKGGKGCKRKNEIRFIWKDDIIHEKKNANRVVLGRGCYTFYTEP